jgi:predicted PurR-regulated permease PerM
MTDLTSDREKFRRYTLLLMVVAVSLVFVFMIRGYLKALFLAVVFSAMATPLYRWIRAKVGGRQAMASALTLLVLVFLVILPLLGFLGIVAAQAVELTENVVPWVQEKIKDPSGLHFTLPSWVPFQDKLAPYTKQIAAKLGEAAGSIGRFLFNSISAGTRGTATFFLNLFIMLYAMFFFLMRGESMRGSLLAYSPLSDEDKNRLIDKGISVARATIKGTLVIGIVQGALGGIGLAVAGIKGAAFWATVMAVLSIIPAVGTALVWIPAVIYLLMTGHIAAGIGLGVWSAAVVGSVDNLLRPRLVGGDTEMPDLLILLSTLGGLSMFGAVGLIIGPVLAGLFLTVWEIYGTTFRELLPNRATASE